MSTKCKEHPGRDAVFEYDGVHYCQKCKDGYQAAVRAVSRHSNRRTVSCLWPGSIWTASPGTRCATRCLTRRILQVGNPSVRC